MTTAIPFDLRNDNPFRIFRVLRAEADKHNDESEIYDLSRGDPGYGFCPSVKGRQFYSFILELDSIFNTPEHHFVNDNTHDFETLWATVQAHAQAIYTAPRAESLCKDFYFFLTRVEKYAAIQGLKWDKRDIFVALFRNATASGGCYHVPAGEVITRLVVAHHHNEKLEMGITYKDMLLTQGVSHGIGTLFKVLCSDEVSYLNPGDGVLMTTPAYAPYNTIAEKRGLIVHPLQIDSGTGNPIADLKKSLENAPENIKMICLIDPNNPTGFSFAEAFNEAIVEFAKKRDILIIADEVYSDFFYSRKKSLLAYAPERTIVLTGRSKIERSTGLRFGELIIHPKGQDHIAKKLLKGKLAGNPDIMALFIAGKAPGGVEGAFQHTTFVTGPSQIMGISHMIFGANDREEYLRRIRVNMEQFYSILGLPYNHNFYYANFNLRQIPGQNKDEVSSEQLFWNLAKRGVVLIPSCRFFAASEIKEQDLTSYARAALPNLTFSRVQKAAHIIKDYMTSA